MSTASRREDRQHLPNPLLVGVDLTLEPGLGSFLGPVYPEIHHVGGPVRIGQGVLDAVPSPIPGDSQPTSLGRSDAGLLVVDVADRGRVGDRAVTRFVRHCLPPSGCLHPEQSQLGRILPWG
jgi:hypothetical protein